MQTDNQALIATSRFTLSPQERTDMENAKSHYPDPRAASIDALKIVQATHGYVPDGAIPAIAEVLGIPAADVEGVATFYSQIFRVPVGRHVVRLCDSMTCYINGHEDVLAAITAKLGIGYGETTADGRFTLLPVCCLGNCDKGSTMMVDDDTHGGLTAEIIPGLLEQYS
ncbi:NADH-quinone oxidoreductase subunit NuoE [Paraperlucidibaca sp.]|jgi:NADH-quinone oxidoreductase subunit E|uniref:NADH-quinone oxidoreductase subunit NuoE n=1 Tax=Paraperlucidibaca sp. TaxID=2708021 RepID=UPI0030F40742